MARAHLPLELWGIGISYRQYDHWAVKGWIQRPGRQKGVRGGTLTFSDEQFNRIVLMVQLVNVLGLPAPRAAELLDNNVLTSKGQQVVLFVGNIVVEVGDGSVVSRARKSVEGSSQPSQGDQEQSMTHAYHEGLEGFVEGAIFQDGCDECERRAARLSINHMDPTTWARTRARALQLKLNGLDQMSNCEVKLLELVGDILLKERELVQVGLEQ